MRAALGGRGKNLWPVSKKKKKKRESELVLEESNFSRRKRRVVRPVSPLTTIG